MQGKAGRGLRWMVAAGIVALGATAAQAANILVTTDITVSETWTANNVYILDKPIYVKSGATLTIEPGTVVRGDNAVLPATDPGTLIITRGSKIRALGTATHPVVFTDENDSNVPGSVPIAPYNTKENALAVTGQWGGVILLGRGYVANNTAGAPNPAREVQIEGLAMTADGLYGNCSAVYDPIADPGVCDDDDSGTMTYVSIRYGGFNLSANNEINGLTLGGVGRATDLHHIEVFQNKDDLVEFFGGAVNLKHFIGANGGDDGIDYDEGWRGKVQFAMVLQGTPAADKSDKAGEHDGGNSPDGSQPRAIPTFCNATYIGLGQKTFTGRELNTALHFRDNAGGRYYNSFFGDFGGALGCIEAGNFPDNVAPIPDANTSAERALTNYVSDGVYYLPPDTASDKELELEDDTFWCFANFDTNGDTLPNFLTGNGANGCDVGKDHFDHGVFSNAALDNSYLGCATPLPIRSLVRTPSGDGATPDPALLIDPRPAVGSPLLTTNRACPNDGFYEPAPYRGAFGSKLNWAEGWTAMSRLGYFPAKPTVTVTTNVTTSTTWTADTVWLLDKPIYVTSGATLTIDPCTVVRGDNAVLPATDPGTLIISRGSKINAVGTPECPIVFTDENDSNVGNSPGVAPYDTKVNALSQTGNWGGLILLGRGYVANNTAGAPNPAREVQIEGLVAAAEGLYGNCSAVYDPVADPGVCDNDDSGSLSYVSIRYGGFNLSANNEINGLTLGAVGRATDIDHIEVLQNKDDLVELFGGAANVKFVGGANGGDDGIDYDEGWRGKIQFTFVLQGTPGTDKSDKAGEHDGGNSPDGSQPRAIPTMYNATYIGLGQKAFTGRELNTALHFRDNTGGRYYNSFFADFGGALGCIEAGNFPDNVLPIPDANTSAERALASYVADGVYYLPPDAAADRELELEDDTFWCFANFDTNGDTLPNFLVGNGANGCDAGKDHFDHGVFSTAALDNSYLTCASALPIRALVRTPSGVGTTPDPALLIDPRSTVGATPLNTTNRRAPGDGFFTPVFHRGAFRGTNWLAGWSALSRLGYFPDCAGGAVPHEVENITWISKTQMVWTAVPFGSFLNDSGIPTGHQPRVDLLRSTSASSFGSATCLEADDYDTTATEEANPTPGQVFFYVLRAEDTCGAGTLGYKLNDPPSSGETERTGAVTCGL